MELQTDPLKAPDSTRLTYMPALDGMRGLAVMAVLFYHGGAAWMDGGYLGVDAFFVISGFLITTLLLEEWGRTGKVALGAFWIRRARRLLPALLLVLAGVAMYAVFLASASSLPGIRLDGFSTLGYVANWRLVATQQSYFETFSVPSPLRHTWSLAIEEQFYLLWPLLVVGVMRISRNSLTALTALTSFLATISAFLMIWIHQPGSDPSRVYYGTDTRAQSLLIGALVALIAAGRPVLSSQLVRTIVHSAAIVAALVLAWGWATVPDQTDWLYEGGFTVAAALVALVIISVVQPDSGPLGRLLSVRPLRWIGLVSYGLYLWHWPVYVVLDPVRTGLDGYSLMALRIFVSFALATASFYAVERPIRRGALHGFPLRVLAPVTAAALVVALVFATSGPTSTSPFAAAASEAPPSTTPPDPTADPKQRVLVVGDSVAGSMAPGLAEAEAKLEVWNAAVPGCGLADTGDHWIGRWDGPDERCTPTWRERWPQQVAEFDPEVVVALFGAHDATDRRIDGTEYEFDTEEGAALARAEIEEAVAMLSSGGAKVVLLTAPYYVVSWPQEIDEERSFYNPEWIDRWNQLLRDVAAAHPGLVTVLDLNRLVDPDGVWADSINGVAIRHEDRVHFSSAGASYIGQWLAPQVEQIEESSTVVNAVTGG